MSFGLPEHGDLDWDDDVNNSVEALYADVQTSKADALAARNDAAYAKGVVDSVGDISAAVEVAESAATSATSSASTATGAASSAQSYAGIASDERTAAEAARDAAEAAQAAAEAVPSTSDGLTAANVTSGPLTGAALLASYAAIKAAPYPVTNLGVVPGTVTSGVAAQNAAYINAFINAHKGTVGGAKLDFGDDEVHVSGPVQIVNATDFDSKIHLAGRGRRATRIYQDDANSNVIEIAATTSGNMRGAVISDIALYKGKRAIDLENANYCLFSNVSFMQQTEYTVAVESSYSNHFTGCWWVHQSGDAYLAGGAGETFFHGCQIGEQSGAIICQGGATYFDGCTFGGGVFDQQALNGLQAMGAAAFSVSSYGSLFVRGGEIYLTHGLVNIDQCRSVRIAPDKILCAAPTTTAWASSTAYTLGTQRANGGNVYQVTTAGTSASSGGPSGTGSGITDGTVVWSYVCSATLVPLLNVRRSLDSGPIELRDATIAVPAGVTALAYQSFIGSDHKNVRIQNNNFRIEAGGDVTFDDRLVTKPELGAVLTGNTFARGVSNL